VFETIAYYFNPPNRFGPNAVALLRGNFIPNHKKISRAKEFFDHVSAAASVEFDYATTAFDLDGANVGDGRFENDYGYSPYYYIEGINNFILLTL
jgi:hypothetical protein